MTDDRLQELLRAALPPAGADKPPRDLWPRLVERLDERPRWSLLDFGLAAAVVLVLVLFPEWLLLLVYHL